MTQISWEAIRLWLLTTGLRIALVLILTWAGRWILGAGIRKFQEQLKTRQATRDSAIRIDTLSDVVRGIGLFALYVTSGLIVLSQLGVALGPLLAAVGIGGLAIGFGAQNLVRDVISGFFILLEDQVRVGDVVSLDGQGGLVEAVNLRHIRLRDLSGTVHYFPNGSIGRVANMTKEFSFYVIDMGVAYKEDLDEVMAVMKRVIDEMRAEESWSESITEPLELLGVERFDDSAVIVRARIKTKPLMQWSAGREFNRRIKKAFDKAGIEIPFPHQTLYWGKDAEGKPDPLRVVQMPASG